MLYRNICSDLRLSYFSGDGDRLDSRSDSLTGDLKRFVEKLNSPNTYASSNYGKNGHEPLSGGVFKDNESFGPIPPLWFLIGFFGVFATILGAGGYISYLVIGWLIKFGDSPSQKDKINRKPCD